MSVAKLDHQKSALIRPQSLGFTLIEVMIGLLIITTAFLGLATVFGSLSKGILVNKTKTIATNLAQEKIESLKNLSYFRLLVTTATNTDANFPGMMFDVGTTNSYYPEETLFVGGLQFKRRTFVEFVQQDGNDLTSQPWTGNDTGIKRITVYVVWSESDEWKKVELRNLRNNPNRAQLEHTFSGKVSSGSTGSGISGAVVDTLQNPAYFSRTDSQGNYSFKVSPGTYTLRATATGYFVKMSTNYVVPANSVGSTAQNFGLDLMGQGTATGYAYLQNHLVITQVVMSSDVAGSGEQEWVELYNPTTYQILVASRATSADPFTVFFVTVTWIDDNNQEPNTAQSGKSAYLLGLSTNVDSSNNSKFCAFRSTSANWTADTTTIAIPSHGFFLIANVSTVSFMVDGALNRRTADAYYYGMAIDNDKEGGIRVNGIQGYGFNGLTDWHDGIAWDGTGLGDDAPTKALEGSDGFDLTWYSDYSGSGLVRSALKLSSTENSFSRTSLLRHYSPFLGNNFDRNENSGTPISYTSDFIWSEWRLISPTTNSLLNSDVQRIPSSGTPPAGGSVSANDGLSSVEYITDMGSFTLTNLATGTWTVTISSGYYTYDVSSVTVQNFVSTGVPNGLTDPRIQAPNAISGPWGYVALTSSTLYGYASGIVRDASGNPLNNVTISAPYANSVTTNGQGRYRISILPQDFSISISASKSQYATEVVSNVGIALGVTVSTINFTLMSAGSAVGFVTTNGTASGALPGIPITAFDPTTTTLMGSAITGADGRFTIPSIVTGTYVIAPQLESGETSSPESKTVYVTNIATGTWVTTFTIVNAYGQISGTVSLGNANNPITTGVLIVASTNQISTETPPDMTAAARSSGSLYYACSSDAAGNYTLPLRGGTSYYLYGWYTSSLDVAASSASKKQVADAAASPVNTHAVSAGGSTTRNITW